MDLIPPGIGGLRDFEPGEPEGYRDTPTRYANVIESFPTLLSLLARSFPSSRNLARLDALKENG